MSVSVTGERHIIHRGMLIISDTFEEPCLFKQTKRTHTHTLILLYNTLVRYKSFFVFRPPRTLLLWASSGEKQTFVFTFSFRCYQRRDRTVYYWYWAAGLSPVIVLRFLVR